MSSIPSVSGFRYYVLFTDEFSRYSWIYPMKTKSEVFTHFKTFTAMIQNIFNSSIKFLQSDNGTEYVNLAFSEFCKSRGIQQRFSCPHTPQQNGLAERKQRHIVTMIRTLLVTSKVPYCFWAYAALTAVHLINLTPTLVLNWITPYSVLFHRPPSYSHLRVFGCSCFPHLGPYVPNKLMSRSIECVFLGYSIHHKGYRCLDPSTGRVYVSRNVIFNEMCFPFKTPQVVPNSLPTTVDLDILPLGLLPAPLNPSPPSAPSSSSPLLAPAPISSGPTPSLESSPLASPPCPSLPPGPDILPSPSPLLDSNISSGPRLNQSPGPCPADHDLPTSLGPHASPSSTLASPPTQHAPAAIPPSHPMVTRLRAGVIQPKTRTDGTVRYPLPHGLLSVGVTNEPTCFSQAHKHAEWRSAMTEEINALLKNNTWSLVPHSPLHAPVGCKWVFRIKRNSDGSFERYKARLVAKGFHQQPGLDFTETFSPVVKPATVRTVLSLAVSRGWSLRQLDVKNAFLHGFLDDDVYMTQPPGFVDPTRPHYVCKLHKALYGLKQAPRAWFHRISTFLLSTGFTQSRADASLFTYHHAHHTIFLLLYVDDIVITGSHSGFLQQFISALGCEFEIKDLGALSYFLGLQVTTSNGCLHLSQLQYAHDLLKRSHMLDCKPTSTPLAAKISLSASDGDLLSSPTSYRELVGCLQYLTITRPDLAFAVNTVAQYMSAPRTSHMIAVKRILRYIKGTLDFGLTLCPQSSPARLTAYSDADWAGCPDSHRSTTGYLIYLGNNLISWCSKKQPTVSRSSTESEYRSLAHACAETTWLSYLLVELGVHLQFPITLHCDNLSATYLAANPVFHARTRHIELDYHFVREKVSLGSHRVCFIPSIDQLADLLTKPLHKPRHHLLRTKLVRPYPSGYPGIKAHVVVSGGTFAEANPIDRCVTDGNVVTAAAWHGQPELISQLMTLLDIRVSFYAKLTSSAASK
ncbi:hypothetical protein L3X38_015569 [Prunus dulcis]|uniref:Integrase catalytic domain-containing protein n=1 Tax=Prunus dulcis TaxID=3755 RepID=A0AAD4W6C7_PRUDU|nr:hypothetical protein L3X38_015569 [Prunus dulcis]